MKTIRTFGQFMIAVIETADKKSGYTLSRILGLPSVAKNVIPIISAILGVGWAAFAAVCGLLILGPIAFGIALVAFIAGGVGALVVAALAIYGGYQAIKLLYVHRIAPLIIYGVGQYYKHEFEEHRKDYPYIVNLVEQASDKLLEDARNGRKY